MVKLLKNSFEGLTDGVDLTVALTGQSGDAMSHVLPETGTIKVSSAAARHGTRGVELTPTTTSPGSSMRQTLAESHGRLMVTRRPFYYGGTHSAARTLQSHFATLNGSTQHGWVQVRANNPHLELAYGNGTFINEARVTLPGVGWYVVELVSIAASASGVSDGAIGFRAWPENSDGSLGTKLQNATNTDLFTNLPITHQHPSAVRWGTAVASTGFTKDQIDATQVLVADDLSLRLDTYAQTRQLVVPPNVRITSAVQPTSAGGTDGKLTVEWDGLDDAAVTGYQIGVAAGVNVKSGFELKATVGPTVRSYQVTGLAPGDYTAAVRAISS